MLISVLLLSPTLGQCQLANIEKDRAKNPAAVTDISGETDVMNFSQNLANSYLNRTPAKAISNNLTLA